MGVSLEVRLGALRQATASWQWRLEVRLLNAESMEVLLYGCIIVSCNGLSGTAARGASSWGPRIRNDNFGSRLKV